eukprot:3203045-Pleurochrysis_carterae.AAC.1
MLNQLKHACSKIFLLGDILEHSTPQRSLCARALRARHLPKDGILQRLKPRIVEKQSVEHRVHRGGRDRPLVALAAQSVCDRVVTQQSLPATGKGKEEKDAPFECRVVRLRDHAAQLAKQPDSWMNFPASLHSSDESSECLLCPSMGAMLFHELLPNERGQA